MPGFCISRAATCIRVRVHSRVRVRSPSQQYKKTASYIKAEEKSEISSEINEFRFNSYLPESETGNRVMVVVDSSPEAKGALEWALSHTVQSQDTIILLHVAKLGTRTCFSFFAQVIGTIVLRRLSKTKCLHVSDGKTNGEIDQRAYDLLRSTKRMCQLKRPEVSRNLD